MSRISSCLIGLFTIVMLAPSAALADPIVITAGTLFVPKSAAPNTLHLEGSRGFTLDSFNGFLLPVTDANLECAGGPDTTCLPGSRISLNAGASDSDLGASVTLDGKTFTTGLASDQGGATVVFTSSFIAPDFTADHVTVLTPFSFTGTVTPPLSSTSALTGSGTVRLDLALVNSSEGPRWDFRQAHYDFASPAAVPEPATLVLVGTGIAGCLLRRRQRATH